MMMRRRGGREILIKSQFEQGLAKLVYCTHRSWSITGQTFTTGNTAAVSFGDIMLSSNYVKHHHHYWCRIILFEKFGIQQNKKKTTESETNVKCWSNWFGPNIIFIHQLSFSLPISKENLIGIQSDKKLFVLYKCICVGNHLGHRCHCIYGVGRYLERAIGTTWPQTTISCCQYQLHPHHHSTDSDWIHFWESTFASVVWFQFNCSSNSFLHFQHFRWKQGWFPKLGKTFPKIIFLCQEISLWNSARPFLLLTFE